MADVLTFARDMLFTSKIREVAKQRGVSVAALKDPAAFDELGAGARLAILDLRLPGALEILAAIKGHATHQGVKVVGFIDHERIDVMDDARARGCDQVMTKGQ
ncbi:MAG TPA: hypothetical protein VGG33_26600, partial [Polyangia bacterium]